MPSLRKSIQWKKRALKAKARSRRLRSFGENALGILVKAKTGYFVVSPEDAMVGKQLLHTGEYNTVELERIVSLVGPEGSVLVVGAHLGAIVVPLSRQVKSIAAVEANPDTFQLLQLNLKLNACTNVRAFNLAAANQAGTIEFLLNRENSGGSKRMPIRAAKDYFYDQPQVIQVRSERLDDVFKQQSFDLILLDIEGSEYFALQGAKELLSRAKTLIVEFRPNHLKDVAGVEVREFLEQIPERFSQVQLPERGVRCSGKELPPLLQAMYEKGENEDGIIFSAPSPP